MASEKPKQTPSKLPAVVALAALMIVPATSAFEGLRTHPYKDQGGVWTVCDGETQVLMHVYTKVQCGVFLDEHLAATYAPEVNKCLPSLAKDGDLYALGAFIDAAYNTGGHAVCHSRMADNVRQGSLFNGCRLFMGWYTGVKGKVLPGLVRRRVFESYLCMVDVGLKGAPKWVGLQDYH